MAKTTDKKWLKKLSGLVPLMIVGPMLLAACGGDATPTVGTSPAEGASTAVTGAGEGASTAVTGAGEGVGTAAANAGEGAGTAVTGAGENIGTAIAGSGTQVAGMGAGAGTAVAGAGEGAGTAVAGAGENMGTAIAGSGTQVAGIGEGAGTAVAGAGENMGTAVAGSGTAVAGMPGEMMFPQGAGAITLWHGYTGAEAATLSKVINTLQGQNTNFKVNVLAVPFDQLQNKFRTEASTGGGPDLLIGPSDWIGDFADAELISPLDGMEGMSAMTGNLLPSALEVSKYNGKLYGIPTSLKNVALYYNTDLVKTVPANTDALLTESSKLATGNVKYGLALDSGFYNSVGYNFAFGGKLFTDPKTVDLTTQGTQDWLAWMKKASETQGVFVKAGAGDDINNLFKTGQAAMLINGPWALADYQKALGKDKVGVAVAPSTPSGGKFAPFLGVENYYVNANSQNQKAALAFVDFIGSPGVANIFVNEAGQISTNTKIDLSGNPALGAFVEQAKSGTPFPNFPAMGKVWDPAGNMINEVIDGKASPADAAKKANDAINSAIKSGQ